MKVSHELDNRFRDTAAAAGLLDVAYDVVDTPIGKLFVATTERGLCRISYDPDSERVVENLARTLGTRVLRAPRPIDEVRRQLDEYFEQRRQEFDLDVDLRPAAEFSRRVLQELALVPYGEVTTDPDRAPLPSRRRVDRQPRRLRRRAGTEGSLAQVGRSDSLISWCNNPFEKR